MFDELRRELEKRWRVEDLSGRVHKGRSIAYSEHGDVPIIRSGDLVDIEDDTRFLRAYSSEPIIYLRRGDVLISSIGFGSIGKVQIFDKPGRYGTVSEVTIIRQQAFNPYYLAAFLRSRAGQHQIDRFITGATGQLHLYPRDVERIFVPLPDASTQLEFQTIAQEERRHRQYARDLLNRAIRAVEIAIEDSEAAALRFLDEVGA
ncbi:MAG: restriction endonuclease subunit S [Acidobacteria bacterium]|nr:restriction endonuclease subunit S [Acidobacteriota bacterium]